MPMYEYHCTRCGSREIELNVPYEKHTRVDDLDCPECMGTGCLEYVPRAPATLERTYRDGINRWPHLKDSKNMRKQAMIERRKGNKKEAERLNRKADLAVGRKPKSEWRLPKE